jgi:hypothetical protein
VTAGTPDPFAPARAIADALLYEGYVLYPYRASAPKNQLRWQHGVLVPPALAALDGAERSAVRTECIVAPGSGASLQVRLRCLQVQHRSIEAVVDRDGTGHGAGYEAVDALEVDGARWVAWDEAVDHDVDVGPLDLRALVDQPAVVPVHLAGGRTVEALHGADGSLRGRAVRVREPVDGRIRIGVRHEGPADAPGSLLAVSVVVENVSGWCDPTAGRDDVVRRSLVAVHVLLAVEGAAALSLLDPPPRAAEAVTRCHNDGLFPVLVGPDGDLVLASPIILYDQPRVAPESVGDHYDATEIDELLALRVLTLTDAEKAEARGTDRRAGAIVDRSEAMGPAAWARLHGAVRSVGPAGPEAAGTTGLAWWDPAAEAAVDPTTETVDVGGVTVGAGSKVVLRPGHRRADAQDLFLAGMRATVTGVLTDADGHRHVTVSVDDDPATEALAWQRRYLFFHPDEIEPLPPGGAGGTEQAP